LPAFIDLRDRPKPTRIGRIAVDNSQDQAMTS
jgi:hypothetical protein